MHAGNGHTLLLCYIKNNTITENPKNNERGKKINRCKRNELRAMCAKPYP